MKRSDIVAAVEQRAGLSHRAADAAVENIFEQITNALARGESVALIGFGSFSVRDKPEREGRNPGTGEALVIPAHKVPVFKAGAGLKKVVAS